MENFGLDVPIMGKSPIEFMSDLIERNENQQIEIERGKQTVSLLKQLNNRCRLMLDAAKYELKRQELEKEKV